MTVKPLTLREQKPYRVVGTVDGTNLQPLPADEYREHATAQPGQHHVPLTLGGIVRRKIIVPSSPVRPRRHRFPFQYRWFSRLGCVAVRGTRSPLEPFGHKRCAIEGIPNVIATAS